MADEIDQKMARYEIVKRITFTRLVAASSLRYLSPLIGLLWFGFLGCLIGVLIGLVCHWVVKDVMGLRLFEVKPIKKKEDFIELRRSFIPFASEKLQASGYRYIEENSSVYAKEYLRRFSEITHFEFINACLFDEQYGQYAESEVERLKLANNFHSNAEH